jgi:hypothetical protein
MDPEIDRAIEKAKTNADSHHALLELLMEREVARRSIENG